MSRIKVVLIGEGDPATRDCWSGTPAGLYRELEARGHEVVGLDVSLDRFERGRAAASTFSLERVRWGVKYHLLDPGRKLRSRKATKLALRHADADLVIQFGGTFKLDVQIPHWVYADANIELALEAAETGHSDAAKLTPAELDLVFRKEKEVYDGAQGVFAMSERCRSSFLGRFGLPEPRVRTVFAGANYDRLPELPEARQAQEAPVILFLGRAFDRKGGPVLLRAFAAVRERVPEAELWIVGPDKRGIDQPGVREFGFIDKDRPGGEDRVRELYESATVFCLPTEYEPFGIAFVEAMMHGLPCVGPNAWAVPEIIVEDQTGLLHKNGDASSVCDCLVRLLEDPELATRFGRAGRARAMSQFTWAAVVDRMLAELPG